MKRILNDDTHWRSACQCDVSVGHFHNKYRSRWEVVMWLSADQAVCKLCQDAYSHTLVHYVMDCRPIEYFRPPNVQYQVICDLSLVIFHWKVLSLRKVYASSPASSTLPPIALIWEKCKSNNPSCLPLSKREVRRDNYSEVYVLIIWSVSII